jgi:hypothetical protein
MYNWIFVLFPKYLLHVSALNAPSSGTALIMSQNNPLIVKVKVKCTLVQALRFCTGRMAHRGSRGIALLFLDHGTRRCNGSASRPGRSLPPGKARYPLYRRLGGPEGRSGQVRKISPPPGFDPRTVQPLASHYTDYFTRPTFSYCKALIMVELQSTRYIISELLRMLFASIKTILSRSYGLKVFF